MLNLDTRLTLDRKLCEAGNLTSRFPQEDLNRLGAWVWAGYDADEKSRMVWLRRTEAAMDLATQVQKDKNFPWANCSNVTFPLITIAAMEFHSRAYPTLIEGTKVVKMRVPAPDPQGQANAQAIRVGDYMSYQVLEEDQSWEEQHDRAFLQVPIVGCAFMKTRHLPRAGHNTSELVSAKNLVMNYWAKSVEDCYRKTHVIELSRNEVYEKCKAGTFRDFLDEPWYQDLHLPEKREGDNDSDKRTGTNEPMPDESTPLRFLEQHVWVDMDGDGYAEPYIITIESSSQQVARIVARWESPSDIEYVDEKKGEILRINATEYFTKYGLIPSPDGSVYDIGFGVLLGPLNEAVNALVNQLVDAGTLSNASGGFLSRAVKIRGGVYTFSPFQWNRADCSPDDLKNGIVPIPVRDPSEVLFTLLSFLVQYTQRISGATDALAGENPGQNTKTGTHQEMIQQGMKIYSALFKRMWRCMKEEFRKLYILNAKYMPAEKRFGSGVISRDDFRGDPSLICPAADPNVVSEQMRIQLAMLVADRAHMVPGYDIPATERNFHQALRLEGSAILYPGPDKVPPLPNPKVQVEQMKAQVQMQKLELEKQQFVMTLQEDVRLNNANIIKLLAQAAALEAQAQSESQGHTIALIDSMIASAKLQNERLQGHIDSMLKAVELDNERREIELAPKVAAAKPAGGD